MGAQESGETLQPSGFWKNIPFKVQTASWKFGASHTSAFLPHHNKWTISKHNWLACFQS